MIKYIGVITGVLGAWLLLNAWPASQETISALSFPLPQAAYHPKEDKLVLTRLAAQYPKAQLPQHYEIQALKALSHYPELRQTAIQFTIEESPFAHTCRPDWKRLLWPWQERIYVIAISKELDEKLAPTVFTNLSYNAQIGVLGHELAHIVEYEQGSNTALMWTGIQYLFREFRQQFERETDIRAIDHGLGFQLLEWSKSVHHLLQSDGRGYMYLNPQQIVGRIRENSSYDETDQGFFNNFDLSLGKNKFHETCEYGLLPLGRCQNVPRTN